MYSKEKTHIVNAYKDFMRYEGIPEGLHRDLAPEQKVDDIIDINRTMRVRDTFSEAGNPNQNSAEAMGVKIVKQDSEGQMNRCGAPYYAWPYAHTYIADINNHCAIPFFGWKKPISKRHGYTPNISAFLLYMFWEAVYYKAKDKCSKSNEKKGRWLRVSYHVGDMLTDFKYFEYSCKVVSRSSIRSADPHRGGDINKRLDPDCETDRKPSLSDSGKENGIGSNETILNITQEQHEHETRKSPRLNPPEKINEQPTRRSPRIHTIISKN